MNDPEVRRYYLAAKQHLDAADILLKHGRYRVCQDLAGLSVECALKALVLSYVPVSQRPAFVERNFKGPAGHSYDTILRLWFRHGGSLPTSWIRELRRLRSWSVAMRYDTARIRLKDVEPFYDAAQQIVVTVSERIR